MSRGPGLECAVRTDQSWRLQANCRDLESELFFPQQGGVPRRAREICAQCSVWEECLRYSLTLTTELGVWAGTTPKQRRLVRAGRLSVSDLRLKLQGV